MLLLLHNCIPFKKRVLFLFTFFPKWVFREPFIINCWNDIFVHLQNICRPRIVTSIKSALVCLHVSIVCHLFVIQCTIKNIVFRNNHYWENVCHLWLILFSFQRLGVHFELVAFVLLNYLYRRDEFATLAHCLINSTIVILSSSQLWFIQRHFIFVFMSKCWYFTCLKLNGIVLLSVIERSLKEENRYKWI